jgi:glycosyltransferase involved in cell wall biosynthesis
VRPPIWASSLIGLDPSESGHVTEYSRISIVVPCFNEEEVVRETYRRLAAFAEQTAKCEFEFIFVDDGSRDATRRHIVQMAQEDPRVKLLGFARNFGHQVAVTAGIDSAGGDAVVVIDADLQDPPEIILQMIAKWREGYDVVYGARTDRPGESFFKLASARWFYRMLRKLSDVPIPLDAGDFRLLSRRVVEVFRAMPERDRFVRGMVSWIGFRQIALPYRRAERFAGSTKYPLSKMLRFALDGILSFSTRPLQVAIGLGFFAAGLALVGIGYALVLRLFTSVWIEGWTALIIAVLFLGGVQLICILGEYIGRIYGEVKRRPLYVVDMAVGLSPPDTPAPGGPVFPGAT